MADKAKHAHGSRKNLEAAIASKAVDAFDVLFLSGEDENPAMGWLDKNGNPIIISPADEVEKLETQVEAAIATKANVKDVEALEGQIAEKVSAEEVDSKIKTALGEIECAPETYEKVKYEITDVPEGTLIKMNENEIRICCPANSAWEKQAVGAGGDPNTYYVTFRTYVYDDNVVGYIEHLGDQVDTEILTDLKTDEYGRRYQPSWLGVAKYNESTGSWSYYGANSSEGRYIGWDYQLDLYDANGVMISSDSIRINLSNEDCHYAIEPYYVGSVKSYVDTQIKEKIAEVEAAYEIVEF